MLSREAEGQLSENGRRYMKTIEDVSREMGVLIDDLLAFSRMGRAEMIEATVNLDSLVQDTLRDLEPAMQRADHYLENPALARRAGRPRDAQAGVDQPAGQRGEIHPPAQPGRNRDRL